MHFNSAQSSGARSAYCTPEHLFSLSTAHKSTAKRGLVILRLHTGHGYLPRPCREIFESINIQLTGKRQEAVVD